MGGAVTKVPLDNTDRMDSSLRGVTYRLVLRIVGACDKDQSRAHYNGGHGRLWQTCTCVAQMLWQSGRPVLFLDFLCLVAAGLLLFVDGVLAAVFLIAGCSALMGFVMVATAGSVPETWIGAGRDMDMEADSRS